MVTVVLGLLFPVLVSLAYMPTVGAFWQGRYELPFFIGVLPSAGFYWIRPVSHRRRVGVISLCGAVLVVVDVACVVHVEQAELRRLVSVQDPAWVHPSLWVTG